MSRQWIIRCALLGMLTAGCETGGGLDPLQDSHQTRIGPDAVLPDARAPDIRIIDAQVADRALDMRIADTELPDAQPPDIYPDATPIDEAPIRSCDTEVTYTAPPGTQSVLLAGDFTNWADGALPMENVGGTFRRIINPADGVMPGQLYPYKLIVDDRWIIDPHATHRKYEGDCVNGGLLMPACDAGPLVRAEPIRIDTDQATAHFTVYRAIDEQLIEQVSATLDGSPIDIERAGAGYQVTIDALAVGKHRLTLNAIDAMGRAADTVHQSFWIEDAPFNWRDTIVYMVLVDRFKNGDPSNDNPIGDPVVPSADWAGGDLQGVLDVLESGYFERLGIRAIWLSPINAQVGGHFPERGGAGHRIAAYHGYWPIRGRAVELRFGGNEALHALVDAAHRRGIRILLDLINNQVHEDHVYVQQHPDWFRTACVCGQDPGCGWSERPLDCLFAEYLPDINWRHPGAAQRFIQDAIYWIDEFDVDGFRVDAVKHVETTSIYNLRAALDARFGQGERIVMLGETAVGQGDRFSDGCGEIFNSGYEWIDAYTGSNALDGQFAFPTHHRMQWAALTGGDYTQIDAAISAYKAAYDPEALHVQFLGSHDSSRMASRASQDPARDCRWSGGPPCDRLPTASDDPQVYQRLRRAFTLLYTIPGIPLLYYGDDIAMAGGNDPDNRRPMIWAGLNEAQTSTRAWLETLGAVRSAHPVLGHGDHHSLLVEPDLYIYARHTADDAVIVILNRGGPQMRTIDLSPLGRAFGSPGLLAGRSERIRVDRGDRLTFQIDAGASLIIHLGNP